MNANFSVLKNHLNLSKSVISLYFKNLADEEKHGCLNDLKLWNYMY